MSIPRQVNKTYFVLAMIVILCILFPGLQVIWTAHHLRTSTKTFTTLRGICRRKKVAPLIKPNGIRSANGEQQVEFVNGSMIMFGARAQASGAASTRSTLRSSTRRRSSTARRSMTWLQRPTKRAHEHGALLLYMGTPPRKV